MIRWSIIIITCRPIVKMISFIVSGRRTYIDVLSKPFLNNEDNAFSSGYIFCLTTINYRLSDRDKLFLSGYFGRDVLVLIIQIMELIFKFLGVMQLLH